MDFLKFHCPVCNSNFTENDDVVVCPDCGTPHHRECYKKTGKCFNENMHGSDGFSVENLKNPEIKKEPRIFIPEKEEDSENKQQNPFKFNDNKLLEILKASPAQSHLIEGKHSNLYEIAIGKNQGYYIPRFMMMSDARKGFFPNFIAFIAPLSWSLYRKMYKFAAIIFAAYIVLFGLSFYTVFSNAEVTKAMNECVEEVKENPGLYTNGSFFNYETSDVTLTEKQQNLINAVNNLYVPGYMTILSFIVPLCARAGMCIFGNKLYLSKLCKNIDKAEKKGLEGDNLKKYLYKRYGTFPMFFVIIAFLFEMLILY